MQAGFSQVPADHQQCLTASGTFFADSLAE
jgi:hypothetical protein